MNSVSPLANEGDSSPWMPIARREIGVSTYASGQSNPRVTQYHADTNIAGYNDKASWCSSFVNWSLAQAGFVGTGSALARSWLDWGEPLIEPVPGCIAVLSRDDPAGWKGHVGFFLRLDDEHIHLLGGNQLDQVREHFYSKSIVLGYRWPAGHGLSDCKHQAANGQVMPGMSTAIIMP